MVENWFLDWFGTKYYHLLYEHRDVQEAQLFLDNVLEYLGPQPGDKMLDIGCGTGRHAIYLAEKGYRVTGIDVVPENIEEAKKYSSSDLSFTVHDMRDPFRTRDFDYALNLFTSFGYFETEEENLQTIDNIHKALKLEGVLVIDYLNCTKTLKNLVKNQRVQKGDVLYNISRYLKDGFIFKEIVVNHNGHQMKYMERVECLYMSNFEEYFQQHPFKILNIFGDYNLQPFDVEKSDRLIIIAQKIPHD